MPALQGRYAESEQVATRTPFFLSLSQMCLSLPRPSSLPPSAGSSASGDAHTLASQRASTEAPARRGQVRQLLLAMLDDVELSLSLLSFLSSFSGAEAAARDARRRRPPHRKARPPRPRNVTERGMRLERDVAGEGRE